MWLQTGAYSANGLYWLIAIAVIFVIAIVALIVASSAMSAARRAGYRGAYRSVDYPAATGRPNVIVHDDPPRRSEALKVLDDRFAKGEISREEYMQRQNDLMKQPSVEESRR